MRGRQVFHPHPNLQAKNKNKPARRMVNPRWDGSQFHSGCKFQNLAQMFIKEKYHEKF
jgi:hypothetical protein